MFLFRTFLVALVIVTCQPSRNERLTSTSLSEPHSDVQQQQPKPQLIERLKEFEFTVLNSSTFKDYEICEAYSLNISYLAVSLANGLSSNLLTSYGRNFFKKSLFSINDRCTLFRKIQHILLLLSFSEGEVPVDDDIIDSSVMDLSMLKTLAAHQLLAGSEKHGLVTLSSYLTGLKSRIEEVFYRNNITVFSSNHSSKSIPSVVLYDHLIEFLLSEAQGNIVSNIKMSDLALSLMDEIKLESSHRFRLGVGLAKLGLFDLSLRHVSLSASPWEAPLYKLRAKLMFPPVQHSVRALAQSVDQYVRQAESVLLSNTGSSSWGQSEILTQMCNSPNEAALALQSLPLLHLAGFTAPRDDLLLGHLPVGLQVLLSEVFVTMCPPMPVSASDVRFLRNTSKPILRIGFVAGSLDSTLGRIVVGLLEEAFFSSSNLPGFIAVAMCFPTPRDDLTDRAGALFHEHVNLSPHDKSEAIERILLSDVDLIVFVDAALDSRVFALAHERLAPFQAVLWGWGSTIGIPSIDYYFVPWPFISNSRCPIFQQFSGMPQELFHEQVVFLEGFPRLASHSPTPSPDLWEFFSSHLLLDGANASNIYLFPGSVRHLHPEFDAVLQILLRTDPFALVVLAVMKSGRDKLPTTHVAVRHDLMHPVMPVAAIAKLYSRLQLTVGPRLADRVRILPPLSSQHFRSLMKASVAVLDPFPVGMHVQILDALIDEVPVVTAPMLQECTNSHANSIAANFKVGPFKNSSLWRWPTTVEEYAVFALKLQNDKSLRDSFRFPNKNHSGMAAMDQLIQFLQIARQSNKR